MKSEILMMFKESPLKNWHNKGKGVYFYSGHCPLNGVKLTVVDKIFVEKWMDG